MNNWLSAMPNLLDANLIIRYLVEDDKEKTEAVEKLLKSKEKLILTDVTVSEIIWVLSSYYEVPKEEIAEKVEALLLLGCIKTNKKILFQALSFYKKLNIDWVDAYLSSFATEKKIKRIYSYDKDLDKIREINREEP